MKLTFRTITGANFNVEAEDSTKVGELKAKVEEVKGADFPKDAMKLVYKGKILDDEAKAISEYGVNETGFLVVFIQKKAEPKPAPAAAAAPSAAPASTAATPAAAAAPAATPAAPAAPAPSAAPAAAGTPAAPAAAAAAAAAIDAAAAAPADVVTSAASSLVSGGALESAVTSMVEMGFAREEVMRAMRAAYNNPDRAYEYLVTGIPATAPGAAQPAAAAGAAPAAGAAAAAGAAPAQPAAAAGGGAPQPFNMFAPGAQAGGAAGGAADGGALDFLRTNPQFQLLRRAVASNPNILIPMLQELGKSNPQLLQMINSNQQEFMRLLAEAPDDDEMAEALAAAGGMAIEVELTPEDEAAITRLEGLGFQRDQCIEAYLACDKNEEVAANFLLENGFD